MIDIYSKKNITFLRILYLFFIFILFFYSYTFAAYPKLVSTIVAAFETIKTWIVRIATPAAAVAVRFRCIYEKI